MVQNSHRDELLKQLNIASSEPWAAETAWSPEINQRVIDWTGKCLIPERHYTLLHLCRPQLIRIWDIFLNWLKENETYLDIKNIDLDILMDFERQLPSLGWSKAAIHLVEVILVTIRKHLHIQRIIRTTYVTFNECFSVDINITVEDYRTIRQYFLEMGNDYEILYFELITLYSALKPYLSELKGKNVSFQGQRAVITPEEEAYLFIDGSYQCPLSVSLKMLKLLRSRNILANELIFYSIAKLNKDFQKKVKKVCKANNIPYFAVESLQGFLERYCFRLEKMGLYSYKQTYPLIYPLQRTPVSQTHLEILEGLYKTITEKNRYYESSYKPLNALVKIKPKITL